MNCDEDPPPYVLGRPLCYHHRQPGEVIREIPIQREKMTMKTQSVVVAVLLNFLFISGAHAGEGSLNDRLTKMENHLQNIEQLLIELKESMPAGVARVKPELPDALGADERSRLFDDFREAFNSGNLQTAFEVLHPLVRISMSADQAKKILSSLMESFGTIDEYIYSHFNYDGYNNGFHTYTLIYRVKYSGGNSGATSGSVTITVFDNGEEIGISTVNLI